VSEYCNECNECDGTKRYDTLKMPHLVSSEKDPPRSPSSPPSPSLASGRWATTRSPSFRSSTRPG
jgi:hypothetical protein